MESSSAYIIVSEGSSERAYIQQLRSFLANKMPVADDFRPRFDLIPKVTNNGAGGGRFALVQQTYRKCRKADKHTPIMIWVDVDIYVRNDGAAEQHNAKSYANRKELPDFLFSVMNFEDFLALHFDDDLFETWYEACSPRHLKVPMHGSEHKPIFDRIWEVYAQRNACKPYSKGDLPSDFISLHSLKNLMRHVDDPRIVALFRANTPTDPFAEFLVSKIRSLYAEFL